MHQTYLHLLLLLLVTATATADTVTPGGQDVVTPHGEDNVKCFQGVQEYLGTTTGVSFWSSGEHRVMELSLPSMSLTGSIPSFLQYCRSVTALDLSSNNLSGLIPPALCDWLPFLVSLDLSDNNLSGPIPSELGNCRYLNSLKLDSNFLSGQIPASLTRLDRLKVLDLSNNRLTGCIPVQFSSFDAADFENNIYQPHSSGMRLCKNNNTEDAGDGENSWFYLIVEFGFVVGFLGMFFVLLFKASWRYAYFRMVDNVYDMFYVYGALTFVRLKGAA